MATQEQRTSIRWDYAPAPESPDHVRLRDSYGLFIDAEFQDPVDGTRVGSVNPATEEMVAEVALAGPGVARRGRPARGRALLPLRGLGGQALVRHGRPRCRAARRGGSDRALELPAADGGLEAGAGARVREHRGPEARRDHAGHRAD